jgi:type II secretory pathway component PulM
MMTRFNMLTLREKIMVMVMIGLIALFIIGQFILAPLMRFHSNAAQAQQKAQNDRAFIEQNIGRLNIAAASQGREIFSRTALLDMSRQAGIERVSRIQPQPNGDIKVWMDDVASQQVFTFLQNIDSRYETRVTAAQMTRQDTGFVSVQISFSLRTGP